MPANRKLNDSIRRAMKERAEETRRKRHEAKLARRRDRRDEPQQPAEAS